MAETELERAEKKYAQAKARLLALKNRAASAARKMDTRRKVILGGALVDLASRDDGAAAMLDRLVGHDASPCFTTDATGAIDFQNTAAQARFGASPGATLVSALGDHFASPGAVLFRLQSRAAAGGAAREDVVTLRGHIRLSAHRVGPERFLWRLEEFQ